MNARIQSVDTLSTDLLSFVNDDVSTGDAPASAGTDLLMSGLVDSLGVVRIVDWLEARLDIEIDPSDVVLEHFVSVDAIIAFLHARDDAGGV